MIKKTWIFNNIKEEFTFLFESNGLIVLAEYTKYLDNKLIAYWSRTYSYNNTIHLKNIGIPNEIQEQVELECRNIVKIVKLY